MGLYVLLLTNIVFLISTIYYYKQNKLNTKLYKEEFKYYEQKYKTAINDNNSLKKEIRSLYKTIDEFTTEKAELACENEVCEKTLKKNKK